MKQLTTRVESCKECPWHCGQFMECNHPNFLVSEGEHEGSKTNECYRELHPDCPLVDLPNKPTQALDALRASLEQQGYDPQYTKGVALMLEMNGYSIIKTEDVLSALSASHRLQAATDDAAKACRLLEEEGRKLYCEMI